MPLDERTRCVKLVGEYEFMTGVCQCYRVCGRAEGDAERSRRSSDLIGPGNILELKGWNGKSKFEEGRPSWDRVS